MNELPPQTDADSCQAQPQAGAGWCLSCEHLSVRRGPRLAVQDSTLTLRAGECVSIVGPNGSGKTTLLLALLGLLPPAAGTVRLDGRRLDQLTARQRGRFAAYVPQVLDRAPAFTVYDVVAGGRYPHVAAHRPLSAADHAAVRGALELCGLTPLAERSFDTLSGGERQKTLIAAAMAQDPQVLFLDEPNTALDPGYQVELVRILRDWHRAGRGLLLVSHDLQLPAALGGRVVALRDGRIVAHGPVGSVLTPATLAHVYDARFGIATTADGSQMVLPDWWREAP